MIWHTLIKELKLLSRDLHGIAVLFIMPMLFMLIMSLALSDADNVNLDTKIALVGAKENKLNDAFEQALIAQDKLNITRFDTKELDNVLKDLRQGLYKMVILNPNPTQKILEEDQKLSLHVLASTDKSWMQGIKGIIQKNYLAQRVSYYFAETTQISPKPIASKQNVEKKSSPQSQLNLTQNKEKNVAKNKRLAAQSEPANFASFLDIPALDNYLKKESFGEIYLNVDGNTVKQPNSVQQNVPAWLIFGMFFIMIPLSNVMAAEKQTNTITRLRLAKTSTLALLFSKLLPYFFINQLQFIGMITLGTYALPWFGVVGFELHGNYLNYGLLSIAISLSALSYGLLVSVLAKSTEHAVVLGGGGNIIMAAIGGIMVPSYIMPEAMQVIAKLSPMSWALTAFHDLLLNQYSFKQILTPWLHLMSFAALFLILAYIIYDRQLNQH